MSISPTSHQSQTDNQGYVPCVTATKLCVLVIKIRAQDMCKTAFWCAVEGEHAGSTHPPWSLKRIIVNPQMCVSLEVYSSSLSYDE